MAADASGTQPGSSFAEPTAAARLEAVARALDANGFATQLVGRQTRGSATPRPPAPGVPPERSRVREASGPPANRPKRPALKAEIGGIVARSRERCGGPR